MVVFNAWKATLSSNNLEVRKIIIEANNSYETAFIEYEKANLDLQIFTIENLSNSEGNPLITGQLTEVRDSKIKFVNTLYAETENKAVSILNAFEQYASAYFNRQVDKKSAYQLVNSEIKNLFRQPIFTKFINSDNIEKQLPNLHRLYAKILSDEQNMSFIDKLRDLF